MKEVLEQALKAQDRDLCDHCLGRLFAHVGTGTTNLKRGEELRALIDLERSAQGLEGMKHERCWLCDEIFDQVPRFAEAVAEKLQEVQFDNFLVGTRVDPVIQAREEELWSVVGQEHAEPIKSELNREIGKAVYAINGKDVEFKNPQVVALVDTRFAHVELDVAPLFFYGRYRKLSREIPQTKWPCRVCQGKGCQRCGDTGKMYATSVQEQVGDVILPYAKAREHFFHGMGREDIDALMLGNGRPFVIEISHPVVRDLDLAAIGQEINDKGKGLVEVEGLRPSTREEVRKIKDATPEKEYRVQVSIHGKVNKGRVDEVLRTFNRTRIVQRTPVRVSHRRADLKRERYIVYVVLEEFQDDRMTLRLRTESGTYVKEFVHGDEGRTEPNLSEMLGVPCTVDALDVIGIIDSSEV
ncbi:MAG: tRNA pseudouridine synthase Pus10 [Methanomassiliicoccales archaeon PtaB.Bin134]|nr:MAG: tRNA pseudouridine synthase Pus10 [Methanomassiliicoccales archaeon PtaB.Bin134]